jgi:hypothetical protein
VTDRKKEEEKKMITRGIERTGKEEEKKKKQKVNGSCCSWFLPESEKWHLPFSFLTIKSGLDDNFPDKTLTSSLNVISHNL